MSKISYILRVITLSILFGGSSAIVFAAVTLVKAAVAKGIPVAQAAAQNAPIFIHYSPIALVAAIILLVAETIAFVKVRPAERAAKLRFASSGLCVLATAILAFAIIEPMKPLIPQLQTSEEAHAQFKKLHEASRGVMGAIILLALTSLILPAFEKKN